MDVHAVSREVCVELYRVWADVKLAVRGFLYGAAKSWLMVPYQMRHREEMEHLFMLLILTEQVGAPIAPADLRLRLLPHLVPQILYWKRRLWLFDEQLEMTNVQHLGH